MNLTKTLTGIVSAIALAGAVKGQEISGWVNSTLKSNYIASGSILNDSPVIQTDFGINLPRGMSLDLWSNYVIKSGKHNEHDLTLSLPTVKVGNSDISSSVGYWALPGFDLDGIKVASANIQTNLPLKPKISLLYGHSKEFSGFNGSINLGKDIKLTDSLSGRIGVELGGEGKLFTNKIGLVYLAGAANVSYSKGDNQITFNIRNQQATQKFRKEGYDNKTTLSLGINHNF